LRDVMKIYLWKSSTLTLCCTAFIFGLKSLSVSQTSGPQTPLYLAEVLVRELQPENTSYQHKDGYIKWKGENGAEAYESRVDCSGLINILLERSYGLTPNDFEKWLGKRRPYAEDYFDAILQQSNFRLITKIGNVKPGDIVAIRYPPGTNENTGHIMIVAGTPTWRKATKPEIDGTEQWEVSVIDSSESGHGKTDTRHKPDGTFGQGVGQGILRIYTTPDGQIIGYTWSALSVSDYYDKSTRQLVIGRLNKPLK
jgi:hypothetical protein